MTTDNWMNWVKINRPKIISAIFISGGILCLILTLGFFFQMRWATFLWPWEDTRLSYIFIAAITAAVGAPMIWIGLSGEFAAARGGATALGISSAGIAIYLFYIYSQTLDLQILITAVLFTLFVPVNLLIFLWSRKIPIRDQRQTPIMVEYSFLLFIILLILVCPALVRHAPFVFPWPLDPQTSTLFGILLAGAIFYFLAALRTSKWHSARGQLLGFFAYDLVLIAPLLAHFQTVTPKHRTSLTFFLIVILLSLILAIIYLLINKTTRPWRIQEE